MYFFWNYYIKINIKVPVGPHKLWNSFKEKLALFTLHKSAISGNSKKCIYKWNALYIHFVFRVLPDLTVADLRSDIFSQLEPDILPKSFVFVRGVGRHFTEVRKNIAHSSYLPIYFANHATSENNFYFISIITFPFCLVQQKELFFQKKTFMDRAFLGV